MSIELYPSVAKVKRGGVYQNLPGFVPESGADAAQAMIANEETSSTAQYTHATGSYFRLNGTLYEATADIRINDAISVGTNCKVAVLGNDVAELKSDLTSQSAKIENKLNKMTTDVQIDDSNWTQGTINYNTGNNGSATTRLRVKDYYGVNYNDFVKISANTGYLFSVLVYNAENTYLGTVNNKGEIAPGTDLEWKTEFSPLNKDHKYRFVLRKENFNETITVVDGYNNVTIEFGLYYQKVRNDLAFLKTEEAPVYQERINTLYDFVNTKYIENVSDSAYRIYRIEKGYRYHITSQITAANTLAYVQFFDEGFTYISASWANSKNATGIVDISIKDIPNNAKYFGVNFRTSTPLKPYSVTRTSIINYKDEISILFVGNSLMQDGVAYLPYLLKKYYPEIKFKFYMFYNGGYTLAQQYQKFQNDTTAEIFSIADNSASWSNYNNVTKMSSALRAFRFDIVCLQEYFNYKSSYTETDLADWNNCRDYIVSNYTGENALEFVSMCHAPLRSDAENVFNLIKTGNALILKKTIAQDMIPAGFDIYNAMSTDLDNIGDQGHLSPDGTHAQEGLPCLLETYTVLCWLLDKLSINSSVYGCKFRMTTDVYNSINVPGPNLGTGVITGTDAQNLLAQEVAIMTYKEGKKFVIDNI